MQMLTALDAVIQPAALLSSWVECVAGVRIQTGLYSTESEGASNFPGISTCLLSFPVAWYIFLHDRNCF